MSHYGIDAEPTCSRCGSNTPLIGTTCQDCNPVHIVELAVRLEDAKCKAEWKFDCTVKRQRAKFITEQTKELRAQLSQAKRKHKHVKL